MKRTALLTWNNYRYFPYEKELALREAQVLLNATSIDAVDNGVKINGDFDGSTLWKLVYYSSYNLNGNPKKTLQSGLESSCTINGMHKKQSTRYSVHGMHEYKGKFNPQVVRGILNFLGATEDSIIIDPFCGSGTALVECAHIGMKSIGCDVNPLAILMSNAKLKALGTSASKLRENFVLIEKEYAKQKKYHVNGTTAREEYLKKWFDEMNFAEIERLRSSIAHIAREYEDIFFVLASDIITDYSLQEPTQLRIRRRSSPLPEKPIWDTFKEKVKVFLDNLESAQKVVGIRNTENYAIMCDSRTLLTNSEFPRIKGGYSAAITSPPYATALPYIDTQRLSLVWLNLSKADKIGELEAYLTGSREFYKVQKKFWAEALLTNSKKLPKFAYQFCIRLHEALTEKDGFRRKDVPYLLYRYLSDMQDMFTGMMSIMQNGAPFALIVGHNRTTLSGKVFDINTPELLRIVAESCGWTYDENIPLQAYQRYGIHSDNAIKAETLLILRKP